MNCLCKQPTSIIDSIRGEVICSSCGMVLECNVSEQTPATAVLSEGRDDYGVGTMLPQTKYGANGIAARRSSQAITLSRIFVKLRQMLECLGVGTTIRREAYSLCRRLVYGDFATGKDKTVIAAATTMLACRLHGRVLAWSEIPGISTKMRRILRMYREIQYVSGITPDRYTHSVISRLCTDMSLSIHYTQRALSILDAMEKCNFTHGKKPQCVAAAAIVLAGTRISKSKVATTAQISEPGLKNILRAWQLYNEEI